MKPAQRVLTSATPGNARSRWGGERSTARTSYNIYRSTSPGGEGSTPFKTGITTNSFVDTTTVNGTSYYYKISAVNSAGESTFSNEMSATPVLPKPSAPVLTNIITADSQLTLNWTAAANATAYNIYRGTTPGGEGSTPFQTGVKGLTFTDTGLSNGTTYYYEITATNAAGEGPASGELSAAPSLTKPAAPTIQSVAAGDGYASLSWKDVVSAGSYNIYRGLTSGGEGSTPYKTGITADSFVDTAVADGTTYYYRVTAVNGAGEGAASTEVATTPAAPLVGQLSGSTAAASGTTSLTGHQHQRLGPLGNRPAVSRIQS